MPSTNLELKQFEIHFVNMFKNEVTRLAAEIAELRMELRSGFTLRDTTEGMLHDLSLLREKEIADLKATVLELQEKLTALSSSPLAKFGPARLD